ncbi:unnamed protein product [Orchesella dallaii]|uniref:Transmembrane protein n=1 Tax=Orchesella dallaii TaxID=48710 RepID=A0ABP1S2I6_9HEXA
MYKFRTGAERHANYVPPDTSTGLPWSQRPPDLPRFTCGLSPVSLVRFFAGLDIFKNVLGTALFIYLYVLLRLGDKEELLEYYSHNVDMTDFLQFPLWQQRGLLFFMMFSFLTSLAFSIIQFRGAKAHNYTKLRMWFLYQLIMLLVFTAIHIWMFIHGWLIPDRPRKLTGSLFLIFFMNYLWAGYHMYVTALLMKDITYYSGVTPRNRFNFNNLHTEMR